MMLDDLQPECSYQADGCEPFSPRMSTILNHLSGNTAPALAVVLAPSLARHLHAPSHARHRAAHENKRGKGTGGMDGHQRSLVHGALERAAH
jgi:hypothetical protein